MRLPLYVYHHMPAFVKRLAWYVIFLWRTLRTLFKANRPVRDPRVSVGRHTYGVHCSNIPILWGDCRISIGSFCSIAPEVRFIIGQHRMNRPSTFPFKVLVHNGDPAAEPGDPETIEVGNDVWIGARAVIVSNVKVGDGAVIAAGAVVVKDVPPYAVVGGVPARIIKMRFPEETVAELLKIAWWNWPEEKILSKMEEFYGDVDQFIARNRNPSTPVF